MKNREAHWEPRSLEAALTQLRDVSEQIRGYDVGDRPSSPPAELLRLERELQREVDELVARRTL